MADETVKIVIKAVTEQAAKAIKGFAGVTRKAFSGLSGFVKGIGKQMFSLKGLLAGAFAGIGVKRLATSFLDASTSMEKFETTLGTVLKSEEEAAKMMKWISDFAATTPFEIPELVEGATRLEAYGLSAQKYMRTLGDAAGALGKPMMQAVEMLADASQGEFERMKEFGLRATDVAKKAGFETVQEMNSSRENLAKGTEALMQLLEERYSGGMEKLSGTFEGMTSNLKDQFFRFQTMVMEAGVFDYLKEMLGQLLEKVNEFAASGKLKEWAEKTGAAVVGFMKSVEEWVKAHWPEIKVILSGLPTLFKGVLTVIKAVATAFNEVGKAIGIAAAKLVEFYEKAKEKVSVVTKFLGFGSSEKPLTEKINEMQSKMTAFSKNVSGLDLTPTVDMSNLSSLVDSIQKNIRAVRDFGPLTDEVIYNMYAGPATKEAYRYSKELLDLQMSALRSGLSGGSSIGATGSAGSGGVTVNLGGVTINMKSGAGSAIDIAEGLDSEIAKQIRYGRSEILTAISEVMN